MLHGKMSLVRGGGIMYKITEECLSCGICLDECPSGAISEGENHFIINSEVCTECGSCASACPNEAIVEE